MVKSVFHVNVNETDFDRSLVFYKLLVPIGFRGYLGVSIRIHRRIDAIR